MFCPFLCPEKDTIESRPGLNPALTIYQWYHLAQITYPPLGLVPSSMEMSVVIVCKIVARNK